MERGQRGRSRAVTHSLCGFAPQGLGGQRSAPEPPVAAALSQQVRDRRAGGHADVFAGLRYQPALLRWPATRARLRGSAAAAFLPVMKRIISLISRRPSPFSQSPGGVSDGHAARRLSRRRHKAHIKPRLGSISVISPRRWWRANAFASTLGCRCLLVAR